MGITLSTDTVDFEPHDETSGGEGSGHQSREPAEAMDVAARHDDELEAPEEDPRMPIALPETDSEVSRPVSNKADNDPAGQWNEDNGHFQWLPVIVIVL